MQIVAGCLASIPLLLLLKWDIGLSEDSISYHYAAQSFLKQGQFLNVDGSSFAHWPPLMPLLLSLLLLFSEKLLFLLPSLATILSVSAVYFWAKELKLKAYLSLLLLLLFTFHFAVVYAAPMLWSDLLFLGLLLYFLLALRKRKIFPVLCLFISMSLLRYAALFFLPVLLVFLYKNYKKEKIKAIGFLLLALLPILLWLAYTFKNTGHFSGERIFPAELFQEHLKASIRELGRWLIPAKMPFLFHILSALAILLLPIWLAKNFPNVILAHLCYAAGFLSSYFLFDMQEPDARLLLALLPAFLLSLMLYLQKSIAEKKKLKILLLLLICGYSLARGGKLFSENLNGQYGKYNLAFWQDLKSSDLCDSIAELPTSQLMSNDVFALNYFCEKEAFIWPKDRHFKSENLPDSGYFIWFRTPDPYRLYAHTAILAVYKSDTLELEDKWIILQLEKH